MAYTKTNWVDQLDTGNKYTITDNPDNTKAIEYAGTVTQQGTPFSADNMNHIEQGVWDAQDTADRALSAAADNLTTAEQYADNKKAEAIAYTDEKIAEMPAQEADASLDESSTNPIQNKPVAEAINELRSVTLYCTLPTQNGSLTYNGSSQSPSWVGYDSSNLTLGGVTSATNAGTYTATFTPVSPFCWSDGTRNPANATWTIGKVTGTLSLSKTSVSTFQSQSETVSLTTNSNGTVSVSSSNTSKVTASVSGTTITLTGGTSSGSATITVTVGEATNYTAVTKTITVTNTAVSVMTVEIDQSNDDPSARCTYKDDAVGMTPGSSAWDTFFGHYPCILTNGVEGVKLNPNNYAKDVNGNNVDISTVGNSDVMVCFPRLGLKISTSGSKVTVSMTNHPNDPNFEYNAHTKGSTALDKFYMGAYLGYVSNSKLYSLSGKTPTGSQTIGTFRTQAQARGTGYEQAAFYQLLFMQCAYLLKYKSTDSQTAVCMGYVNSSHSAATATGGANTYGMDCGNLTSTQKADKEHQSKCLGIEDFWGNMRWWIDGLYSDSSRNILTANSGFNDTGSGYTNNGQGASSNINGYMNKVQGGTKTGFIIKESSGSTTTHYCDYGILYAGYLPAFGGSWNNGLDAGAFYLSVGYSASYSAAYLGGRLMYY